MDAPDGIDHPRTHPDLRVDDLAQGRPGALRPGIDTTAHPGIGGSERSLRPGPGCRHDPDARAWGPRRSDPPDSLGADELDLPQLSIDGPERQPEPCLMDRIGRNVDRDRRLRGPAAGDRLQPSVHPGGKRRHVAEAGSTAPQRPRRLGTQLLDLPPAPDRHASREQQRDQHPSPPPRPRPGSRLPDPSQWRAFASGGIDAHGRSGTPTTRTPGGRGASKPKTRE